MTTLELFQKHRKGEVSRERFLYEVRRDNNLPWVTNTTSYNDAVKILKNKGIIRESVEDQQFEADILDDLQQIMVDPTRASDILQKAKKLAQQHGESLKSTYGMMASPYAANALLSDIEPSQSKMKNGSLQESYSNVPVDPAADHVNPYFLKRGVNKILDGEKELTNDSYINAVNKASRQLKANPHAFDKEMFANADEVAKADSKLETKEVKKGNHVDKDNGMKKVKGQETLKAQSAPTKENRKGKPKGVKVMPDKGVTGSQKIIKEISSFLKKKLTENNTYNDFSVNKEVETKEGTGVIKAINGSTLEVELKESGKLMDVQMSEVNHYEKKKKEEAEQHGAIDVSALGGHSGGMKLADKLIDAISMYNGLDPEQKEAEIARLKTDIPAELRAKFEELMAALHDEGNYPPQEEEEYLQENEFADEEEDSYDAEQNQPDYYINVSLTDARRAKEIYRDLNYIPQGSVKVDWPDSYVIDDLEIAQELLSAFQEQGIEIIDTDVPAIDSEYDTDYEEDDLDEAGAVYTAGGTSPGKFVQGFKNTSDAQRFAKNFTNQTGVPTNTQEV